MILYQPSPGAAEHQSLLVVRQTVVQESCRHTGLYQRPHLILHQLTSGETTMVMPGSSRAGT